MCEKDSHRRCLPASMVLPVPITLDWCRCIVPRRLFLLGTLDDDYLQSAIECLNVFRCVLTQDSFHTHSLSQRKGVGGHINTWGRHGTSICEARCAARTVMLRSHPIIPTYAFTYFEKRDAPPIAHEASCNLILQTSLGCPQVGVGVPQWWSLPHPAATPLGSRDLWAK